jgi:NADH:ubiquinone oxidoreductase subunit F (NADH-binding)
LQRRRLAGFLLQETGGERGAYIAVEGAILAGLATDATDGFIYIRHEFHEQIAACEAEIRRAESQGVCGAIVSVLGQPFYQCIN